MGEAPAAIEREPLVDGVLLRLPRRRIGAITAMGVVLLVFGLVFTCAPLALVFALDLIYLFALPFAVVGLLLANVGVGLWTGRTELQVRGDELLVVERLGLLRWRRRHTRSGITQLQVVDGGLHVNNRPVAGIGTLRVRYRDGKPFTAAAAYRTATLQEAARLLAAELQLDPATAVVDTTVDSVAAEAEENAIAAVVDQPATSKAVLERNDAGLLLQLPRIGFRNGSGVLLSIGVFVAILGVGTAFVLGKEPGSSDQPPQWIAALPLLVGCALAWFGFASSRATAMVAVANGDLLIKRTGAFGTRRHELPAGSVRSIRVARSNVQVNDRYLQQLAIETTGRTLRLFTGRDDAELAWVAAVLRRALRLQ